MCDAACRAKIIINGGFMAILAPELAKKLKHDSPDHVATVRLCDAANILNSMIAAAGFFPPVDAEDFAGCEQAKLLIHWITGESGPTPDAAERMNKWTTDIWATIADLAAGKLPDDRQYPPPVAAPHK